MTEQELKNRILLHLDQLGPQDTNGTSQLREALNVESETILDCLYVLKEGGFVELRGIERSTVLAQITAMGRLLVKEILAKNDVDSEKAEPQAPINNGPGSFSTADSYTDRQIWLKLLGFVRDGSVRDPFKYTEGEDDLLIRRYFHPLEYYDDILGDISDPEVSLVFGTAGSGKSSLVKSIELTCYSYDISPGIKILPVIYHDFSRLVRKHERYKVQCLDHVKIITQNTLDAVSRDIANGRVSPPNIDNENKIYRDDLWLYVNQGSDPITKHDWKDILAIDEQVSTSISEDPYDLLKFLYRDITRLFGYTSYHILVDPDHDICSDSAKALEILLPLLETHDLLKISESRMAFKFFLNQRFYEPVSQIYWIQQRDSKVFPLMCSREDLLKILQLRLSWCSNERYQRLAQFSEVTDLDSRVIELSAGVPRRLITICNRLFSLHCTSISRMGKISDVSIAEENSMDLYVSQAVVERVLADYWKTDSETEHWIAQGESNILEFKTTMRYNVREKKRDKEMDKIIAKTLCGFMNTQGGMLIIGVDDTGNAYGLDDDIATLQKKNEDGFELAFSDIVKIFIGLPFYVNISTEFKDYHGKRIYVVRVSKSPEPAFLETEQGNEFYVRVGNSTRRLDAKEIWDYLAKRSANNGVVV